MHTESQSKSPDATRSPRLGYAIAVLAIVISGLLALKTVRNAQPRAGASEFAGWEGVLAPDFSVTALDGRTLKLSELKGKRIVLNFWATWCPPCLEEIPHFIRLRNETSDRELAILGISNEDADMLKLFVKKRGVNYPIASARELPSPYNKVQFLPTTFFIDRNAVIQNVIGGYHDFEELKAHALAKDFSGPAKSAPAVTDSTNATVVEKPAK